MLGIGRRIGRKIMSGNEKGATFVEVIVAIVLLGLIVASIPPAIIYSTRSVFAQKEQTVAEYLTRNQIEYIKSQPYILGNGTAYPNYDGYKVPVPDPSYEILITALPIDINPTTGGHDGYLPPNGGDEGIQEITIAIDHVNKVVLTTIFYKVNR